MKKKTNPIYLVLIVDLLIFFTSNCSNRESEKEHLEPIKPPPSFVSFDIDLPIQELEESINTQIKTVLMDDVLDLNKKGDKLFLKIEKNGPLKLNLRQDRVYASIPFTSKVAVKKKVMGMTFSNKDVPIEFAGIAEVRASATLDSLWNLSLKGEDFNVSWTSEPSFDIMGIKIDLKKTINKAVNQNEERILSEMCLAINKNIDFRKILTKVWSDIQKPIRIAKKPTYLWLYTRPSSLNAKVLPMVRDTLSIHAEYSSFIYITSNPNITTEIKQLPSNGETLNDKSAVLAYIETWFLITDLEKLVAEKIVGRSFTFKDYSAVVDDLKLTTEGQKLKANVQLNQGLDAEVVIIGKPVLTPKKELKIEEFSYKVISDDQMAEAANWLPKPLIESYITSMMTLDAAKFLNNLDSIANAGVSKSKLGNKIATHLDFSDVKSYQQQIVGDTLKWVFYLEGSAGLTLKKDAFKKKKSQQL